MTGFGPNGEGSTEGDGVPALEFRPGMIVGVQAGQDAIYLRTRHGDYPYRYAVHVVRDGYVFPVAVEDDAWGTTAIHDFTDAIVPAGLRTNADFGSTFALAPGGEVSIATYQNTTSFGAIQRLYTAHAAGVRDGGVWLDFEDKRHVRTRDATTGTTLRTFERNPDGLLTAIVDADGNRVEVQRGTGYVRFVPPFGPATRIEDTNADGWADRIAYEDAAARGYDIVHDEHGLLQSIARPDGLTHQFIYDELGRLIRDEQPGGRVARLTRRPTEIDLETRRLTQEVTYTSPGGRSTTHETEFGRPGSSTRRTLTHPDGTTTVVEVLPRRPIETADGLEGVQVRETRATASDGTVTELFETIGNGAGFSDPLPARTTMTTPAPSSRQLHLEQTRARTHDPATGELLTETRTHTRRGGSTSRTVTSSYEAATRTFTTTLPSELSSSTVLDGSDRPVEVRAPGLAPLQMGYDARGRLLWSRRVSATGHGTREVSYEYTDPVLGELWTPSTVTSAGARTHLSFDELRRVTSGVTLPVSCMVNADCDDGVGCNGEETCASGECVPGATNTCGMFAYDAVDRVTGVRPLARDLHGLGYDAADRGISYTPPVLSGPSGRVDLARDPDGLVSRVDVDAGPTRSVVTSRHPDGRPQSVQHEGHTITFGYDASTRELTSLATEDGITVSLDTDGPLLESVTWSGSAGVAGAVAFGYDELWDLTTITAGGVGTSYHYDEDGALDCVAPGGTADSTCASGLLIAPNLPARTLVMSMAGAATVTSSYEWSDLGEATQTVHQWSTSGELSFTYDERDGEGRLTRVTEDDGAGELALEYSYDVEGRLIEVKRDGDVSESYTYDPNGQRSGATRDLDTVAPIVWDARDRLTQYGGVTYDYDPAGRRTARTEGGRTTTYTYDLLGALRAVDLPDTTNDTEYLIDAVGRRVGRKVGPIGSGALERAWIYLDDLRPIVEMDGSGTVTRIFVYGAGRAPDLIVVPTGQPDAGTYRVLTDHLDSVRRVVDVASGAVIQQLDYDAFGNVLVDTNPGWQPFGFAAGLYDPGARDPACVLAGFPRGGRPPCDTDGSECGGRCDGTSRTECGYPDARTTCGDPSCADGIATAPAFCTGVGACRRAARMSCAPYACGADACLTSCADASECAPGLDCVGGACVAPARDGGVDGGRERDAGADAGVASTAGGCTCRTSPARPSGVAGVLAILALVVRMGRRSRPRS